MGLDMYLEARKYVSSYSDISDYEAIKDMMGLKTGDIPEASSGSVSVGVMYWRKVNSVHDWFVNNVQDGKDDCGQYYVSREKLVELMETCKKVVDNRGDTAVAEELLPTASGFFFGDTDYEEYYYEGLLWTIEGLERILNNPAYDHMDFQYSSSW
jgi:hypothetical protein